MDVDIFLLQSAADAVIKNKTPAEAWRKITLLCPTKTSMTNLAEACKRVQSPPSFNLEMNPAIYPHLSHNTCGLQVVSPY